MPKDKPLFDLESKVTSFLKGEHKTGKVGLETTGKELSVPSEKTPEPSKVAPSKVERQPPKEAASSKPQTTPRPKQDLMKANDPRRRTKNYERFTT